MNQRVNQHARVLHSFALALPNENDVTVRCSVSFNIGFLSIVVFLSDTCASSCTPKCIPSSYPKICSQVLCRVGDLGHLLGFVENCVLAGSAQTCLPQDGKCATLKGGNPKGLGGAARGEEWSKQ